LSTKTRFATAVAALTFGLTASATAAYATSGPDGPYVGEVRAGDPCTAEQAKAKAWGTHDGRAYRCRATTDANGKPCTLWKRIVVPGEPTGIWSGGPAKCRPACASPKPSPSATPSTSASQSASSAPSGSSAAATVSTTPILPITGRPVVWLALSALFLLGFGAALYAAGRRPRNS
jgi:hypothetical protein